MKGKVVLFAVATSAAALAQPAKTISDLLKEGVTYSGSESAGSRERLNRARAAVPELAGLDDETAVRVLQKNYYPAMSVQELAVHLGVTLHEPKRLGPIDRWRFESCMDDAAKAPTPAGVRLAAHNCRRRFDQ